MTTQADEHVGSGDQALQKRSIINRLDTIGWGLFFIMVGALWLLPDEVLPEEKGWLVAAVGVGVILLGVQGARHLHEIKLSGGAVVVGALAVAYGVTGLYGVELPFFAIVFILIGVLIIFFPRKGEGGWSCGCW
jgi:hypothetical protein